MADGYDRYDSNDSGGGGSFVMGLLTGTVLGAGLGMLFAPKAGSELRNQLSEQTDLAGTMRQRFDRFSSLSDDGIAIVSRATGRIEHANESLCALLGVDRSALEGSPIASVWAGLSDEGVGRVTAALSRAATQSHTELTVRLP